MIGLANPAWWWTVRPDGLFYFLPKPATATHKLTIGKDVQSIRITKNAEKITNRYRLTWSGGTDVYNDATSESLYGRREVLVNDTSIKDQTSADRAGNTAVENGKTPLVQATITVNTNYNIESIQPGDTITVQNTKAGSNVLPPNLLITSVNYSPAGVTLAVENEEASFADTFAQAVTSLNE